MPGPEHEGDFVTVPGGLGKDGGWATLDGRPVGPYCLEGVTWRASGEGGLLMFLYCEC